MWEKYCISPGEEFEIYFKWLIHIIWKLQLLAYFKHLPACLCTRTSAYVCAHAHCEIFQRKQLNIS